MAHEITHNPFVFDKDENNVALVARVTVGSEKKEQAFTVEIPSDSAEAKSHKLWPSGSLTDFVYQWLVEELIRRERNRIANLLRDEPKALEREKEDLGAEVLEALEAGDTDRQSVIMSRVAEINARLAELRG